MIECKHCGKKIHKIIAIEKVAQEYYLGEGKDGNKYGQGESGHEWQLDTLAYQCPECQGDVESQIERA